MHNGSCEGVEEDKKHCPLHEDYDILRKGIIELFSSRTIYDLVKISDNTEQISI
jgi:DNA-binding IscR family transcriptional regulator